MPHGVYDKLREYADTWATLGVRAWGTPAFDNATWWNLKGRSATKSRRSWVLRRALC
ncbi:MAG: hypothetical protein U0703_24480 [Anaerolineae bacterium]